MLLRAAGSSFSRCTSPKHILPLAKRLSVYGREGNFATQRLCVRTMVSRGGRADVAEVPAATLPGTPSRQAFPIKEDRLIELAKEFSNAKNGVANEDMIAPDFRFEFQVISLDRKGYLDAVKSFNLDEAFENLEPHYYHWRVDPFEVNRVWYTTRVTGTHTKELSVFGKKFKPTGKTVLGGPEQQSLVFNEKGQVRIFTGGYVVDRLVGNTKGLGGILGIFTALGVPVPWVFYNTFAWKVGVGINYAILGASKFLNLITFGLWHKITSKNT